MSPQLNPDNANNAANPVCGMQYMVIGGGDVGFTAKQWAVADASLFARVCEGHLHQPSDGHPRGAR